MHTVNITSNWPATQQAVVLPVRSAALTVLQQSPQHVALTQPAAASCFNTVRVQQMRQLFLNPDTSTLRQNVHVTMKSEPQERLGTVKTTFLRRVSVAAACLTVAVSCL